MKDRDKLTQFVSIVDEILKIEGNAWLIDELLLTIENHATYAQLRKHPLITRIHEYCVEEIIEKQAEEFYKDFPIEEIKEQLIVDFLEMEHERRRDNFWKYSLCMFQQFESITNYLFEIKHRQWKNIKNHVLYGNTTIHRYMLNSINKDVWSIANKYKLIEIIYFDGFGNDEVHNYFKNLFFYIKSSRNENHRDINSYIDNNILEIQKNPSKYYYPFYGALYRFVNGVPLDYQSKWQKFHN